jgi:DNA-binding transcriptional LysR family regulator
MLDWSDLQHFLALATTDSLPKAAERLGVNRTTIARRIAELESAFGTSLFERRGRNLTLTQSGREVLAVAEGIDGALQGLGRRVFGRDARLEGAIRVTATSGIAKLLAADFRTFMQTHPHVLLEVNVTNALEDLELMEADVAIRLTASPPETLVGRRLVGLHSALYATPDLATRLHEDSVPYIGWAGERTAPPWVRQWVENPRVVANTNNMDVSSELVASGVGIAEITCYVAEADKRLVRVSDTRPFRFPEAWLLYHPQLRNVNRVRAFAEHLVAAFERLKTTFEGGHQPLAG